MIAALFAAALLPGIVPLPQTVQTHSGTFNVPATIEISASSPDERNVAQFAVDFLATRGIHARIVGEAANAQLRLRTVPGTGTEGYHLSVDAGGAQIHASSGAGLYYGLQTFEQLFDPRNAVNTIPYVSIEDAPRFSWRGIHLDVSRHFFSVAVVERYIDIASHYKLNVFHWHLADDQGWRIESTTYPRLTAIASCRSGTQRDKDPSDIDPHRYCGYYTQRQIRDVVAFAKRRYVTIVPEIDMPGHSSAQIAAYPFLGCTGKAAPVSVTWGGSAPVCPTERAIHFEENVLQEVMRLFPSLYIHTGGDEVPFGPWRASPYVHTLMQREHLHTYPEVQSYFERRIEQFIESKGRRMMGWDEIFDGGISTRAGIMSWRGTGPGTAAAIKGNDVVMTPDGPLYLDAYQGDRGEEPEAIGNLSTPQMIYAYDPVPAQLSVAQATHILGVQGNMWTEYIGTPDYLFYMLFPREFALAEIAWSRQPRYWNAFQARTGSQYAWLERYDYNFRIPNPEFAIEGASTIAFDNVHPSVRTTSIHVSASDLTVRVSDPVPDVTILVSKDGMANQTYSAPIHLELRPGERIMLSAIARLRDGRASTPTVLEITRDL